MNFKEAYSKLLEGKKIRRTIWDKNYYICMKNELTYDAVIYDAVRDTIKPITNIDLDSAAADDWEVVEKNKVRKFKKNERYYFIHDNNSFIADDTNDNTDIDNNRFAIGNCFKTKEEAQHMVEKLKVIKELRDFALENNEEEIDWTNVEQDKYTLVLRDTDNYRRRLEFNGRLFDQGSPFNICFTSEEICKQAAEKVGIERILKYYFDIKEE